MTNERARRARGGLARAARAAAFALGAALTGATVFAAARAWGEEAPAAKRLPPLALNVDTNTVDLQTGQLTVTMSRPAAKLSLKVLGLNGAVLAEVEQQFDGAPAGAPLVVRWAPPSEPVARLEVFGHDTSGYYKGVAITPWSFEIPHEDVVFRTDSADIDASEGRKLEASLALIEKELPRASHLGRVTLFILAHTDSVGTAEYNLRLSTRRAQAIGRWFKGHGLRISMAFDGMGEKMLEVKTADEVPEPANRRVDYMLGVEPPRFKQSGALPAWKSL
jgi:outer membrane protein OmpA-like peptidoglycan-associated protein